MRFALLLLLVACKDKATTEPPRTGSAIADASVVRPLDVQALAQVEVPGWTREVALADARGIDVRYRAAPLLVTVQIAPCFDCLPMQLERWQAKSDALRALVKPELRDTATWELGMTRVGAANAAWTFVVGTGVVYGSAYTLHWNDGTHMIRVVAEYVGDGPSEAMVRDAPKQRLEASARDFVERFISRWG